jgi:hypothetical protein
MWIETNTYTSTKALTLLMHSNPRGQQAPIYSNNTISLTSGHTFPPCGCVTNLQWICQCQRHRPELPRSRSRRALVLPASGTGTAARYPSPPPPKTPSDAACAGASVLSVIIDRRGCSCRPAVPALRAYIPLLFRYIKYADFYSDEQLYFRLYSPSLILTAHKKRTASKMPTH